MDITQELHKRQYETTDFEWHVKFSDAGLKDFETYFVQKYFSPHVPTLEMGTGAGRLAFALEKQMEFNNIIAVDYVDGFIKEANEKAKKISSGIKFQVENAVNLSFNNGSFDQAIYVDIILSHLPRRKDRIKVLSEAYRALKPNGILIINARNLVRNVIFLKLFRIMMKIIRWIYNPLHYEENSLPRLGVRHKLDLFFLRRNKPQIHYYYPGEFISDILSVGFHVIEIASELPVQKSTKQISNVSFNGPNLWVVAKKCK